MIDGVSLLLADDHALVRGTLKLQLDQEPDMAVVADVGTADEAVAQAVTLRPDVILLDIDMPGQFCFEAARSIKTRVPGTHIIFLSAFHHDRYIEQAIAVEASGYITKAESPSRVIEAIRTVVKGGIYYSPEIQMRIVVDDNGGPRLAGEGRTRVSELTRRELEVLRQLARGLSRKQIAAAMNVTARTVDAHTQRVMDKLDIHDRVELARFAIREGLAEA